MTLELTATHCFNQPLTSKDIQTLNISQVHADFITVIVDDNNVDRVFELPFMPMHLIQVIHMTQLDKLF